MLDLLIATALILQEPAPIRVTTRMVEVGVLVHDEHGRAVTGLRADDFRLLDGGRQETIRSFWAAGPERENTPGKARASTAILLDFFNSEFRYESFGRGHLLRFLRELEPRHPVALLALDGSFQILHDFTTDAGSLVASLERYRPYRPIQGAAFRPSKTGIPGIDKIDALTEGSKMALRARQTASSMAALASYLARTPGRKNLIWISSTFPGALAASVRRDDVAVYPIDVTADPINVNTPINGPSPAARMVAERTGGIAFDHGNNVLGGIRQAYEDSDSVYVLGYYPSHGEWNGRLRPIQVTVSRPGVEVRHRSGYVAAMEEKFESPDQRDTLVEIASSPFEARGVEVTGKAKRLENGEVEVALLVHAPAANSVENELELLTVPVVGDGRPEEVEYRTVKAGGGDRDGVRTTQRVPAPPEARQLKVVVRDVRSGALGSVTVPVSRAK